MNRLVTSICGAVLVSAVATAVAWAAGTTSARALVDPTTLQPVPPNAVCRADGPQVICDTFVDEALVNGLSSIYRAEPSTRRAHTTAPARAGTSTACS